LDGSSSDSIGWQAQVCRQQSHQNSHIPRIE
jgi:hypothetical protein